MNTYSKTKSSNRDSLLNKPASLPSRRYQAIYSVVKQIPYGRVATYGQIARLAGLPGQARQVGYALNRLSDHTVAWHRVINAQGQISKRSDPDDEIRQRLLLENEGIVFDSNDRVSLRSQGWQPD